MTDIRPIQGEIGTLRITFNSLLVAEFNPNQVIIEQFDETKSEYYRIDSQEVPYLYKKGNRKIWEFYIHQSKYTDEEWIELVDDLRALNGKVVVFDTNYPNSSGTYNCYFWSFEDDCNRFPAKLLKINFTCIDFTDNDEV